MNILFFLTCLNGPQSLPTMIKFFPNLVIMKVACVVLIYYCTILLQNDIRERKKNDRDGVIPMGVPSIKLTSNQKNNLLKRHVQVKTSR